MTTTTETTTAFAVGDRVRVAHPARTIDGGRVYWNEEVEGVVAEVSPTGNVRVRSDTRTPSGMILQWVGPRYLTKIGDTTEEERTQGTNAPEWARFLRLWQPGDPEPRRLLVTDGERVSQVGHVFSVGERDGALYRYGDRVQGAPAVTSTSLTEGDLCLVPGPGDEPPMIGRVQSGGTITVMYDQDGLIHPDAGTTVPDTWVARVDPDRMETVAEFIERQRAWWTDLHTQMGVIAEDRGWCSEFEDITRPLGFPHRSTAITPDFLDHLEESGTAPEPVEREYQVEVSVEFDFEFEYDHTPTSFDDTVSDLVGHHVRGFTVTGYGSTTLTLTRSAAVAEGEEPDWEDDIDDEAVREALEEGSSSCVSFTVTNWDVENWEPA